ncbi:MAG TPA: Gfo/Idh/MocA family oxidoreductase [Anaerolineae bacterium]|nr:Gfo/Idh/MocA family oxidoreductase [Anaerolineae bacterium]
MNRVAIIGAGAIAKTHIEGYLAFPARAKVVAVVDLYPEKAEEKIKDFNLDAVVYDSYAKLLEHVDFEIASICTPPFAHADTTIAMLNAGKHVLVEKPMATSLDLCDEMIEAARTNGKQLSVVAQNRFKNPMAKLKQVLDSGLIGRIYHAQVDSFWWRGSNYYDLWWRGTWEKEGGGCTMNHAVHHIDLFHWMVGMPDELQAVIANIAHTNSEVEDFSTAVLRYKNDRIGQVTASLVHHGEKQRFVFQGERASVSVPWQVNASLPLANGFPKENPALVEKIQAYYDEIPDLEYIGHTGQIKNFLDAIDGKDALLVDGVEGRKTIEIAMAIYQSGTFGSPVKFPMTPEDPFYTRENILKNAPRFHKKTKNVNNFATEEITLGSDYHEEDK